MPAFPEVAKIKFEGPQVEEPAGLPPLQRRRSGRRQDDEGPLPLQRGLLAHVPRHGQRSVRARHDACGRGKAPVDTVENASQPGPRGLRVHGEAGRAVLLLPRSRRRPRRQDAGRERTRTSTRSSRCSRKNSSGPASSCCGARPTCSATRATCTAPPRACNADAFAYRRGPGEEGPGSDQGTGRRGLHVLGRPRRLSEPVEHRHEARDRSSGRVHAHGRRLRQGDRLHGPVLLRAQAQGADQAPVRLRRRPPASTSSAPTAWPSTSR